MRHVNSAVRAAVLLLAASALTLWQHAHAATVKYYWRVTEFEAAYDGVTRTVFGINDRPGIESPINVTIGDEVEVHLTNELSDFTCIHWHGLRQFGTQEMDGVSGITHCRIPPNVTAVYRFTPDKPGTFWYHSHDHVQYAAGLRGPLIVNQKPELLQPWEKDVAGEHVLLVADWYHAPPVGAPIWDTMVINDKGQYNCTVAGALGLNCTDEQPLPRFEVSPGKTYLFRIINGAALAPFDLSIDDHEFQVIAADSDPLVPSRLVNTVRVNVAQRYDILVKTKENATEPFWIRATGLFGEPWTARPADRVPTGFNEKGLAILDYKPNCRDMPTSSNWTTVDLIDEFAYTPLAPVLLPQLSDERYVVEFTLAVLPQNPGAFLGYTNVNQTGFRSLFVPDYPTLFSVASGTPTEQLPSDSNAHRMGEGNHVEIVLCNETPDQHPFHFHGHSPWVVGSGNAPLSEIIADNATDLKLVAPMQHDVFTVPHCTTDANGQCADVGYVVLRYNADNAGVWMLHCHIDWHFDIGLGMLVVENEAALMAMGLDQFDKQMLNVCNSTGLTRG